jgi:hypothetical protein
MILPNSDRILLKCLEYRSKVLLAAADVKQHVAVAIVWVVDIDQCKRRDWRHDVIAIVVGR